MNLQPTIAHETGIQSNPEPLRGSSLRVRNNRSLEEGMKRTILIYSPDADLCYSLRLLFQETFTIVTTSEPDIMMMMVKSFKPHVVIVDSLPTLRMQERFSLMRKDDPGVHIIVFYASKMENMFKHESIRASVDAAFSKPIDLGEVIKRINQFTASVH